MIRSSASLIAYDVRPSKQIERRAMVEFLNCAKHSGFDIPNYRYVGFGGTKFIDFQLMKRYVGFNSYQSIEHDEDIFDRCVFNRPFNHIDMYKGPLSDFLLQDQCERNSVYWIDLEGTLSSVILSNINSIGSHVKDGDFIFLSISAENPKKTLNKKSEEVKNILSSQLPSLSSFIKKQKIESFQQKNLKHTIGLILLKMIEGAFSLRLNEGSFTPLLKVLYHDSMWMCTVGGVFSKKRSRKAANLRRSIKGDLAPFCTPKKGEFYTIPQFNFTDLERILLDKSCYDNNIGYIRRLLSLGIPNEKLSEYNKISRFVPKYIESVF